MIVQYLIDWSQFDLKDEIMRIRVSHLLDIIRRNGCLITSSSLDDKLHACIPQQDNDTLSKEERTKLFYSNRIYTGIDDTHRNFHIRVDGDNDHSANDLQSTINMWKEYLENAGVTLKKGDDRFILVVKDGKTEKKPFYSQQSIDTILDNYDKGYAKKWTRMQHFQGGATTDIREYLESFSASATDIRIYDPYLSSIFKTVVPDNDKEVDKEARNNKAWRISVRFLFGILLKNNHVKHFDIITLLQPEKKLLLHEVIDDVIKSLTDLGRTDEADISFHFVNRDSSFHDRFLSNGRFCFSIGHGCDICEADGDYEQLMKVKKVKRNGHEILCQMWRNMPRRGSERCSEFNVFYGCSKYESLEIPVFKDTNDRKPNKDGKSEIYPSGCYARQFNEIKDFLDFGKFTRKSPLDINYNRLKVCINPLTLTCDKDNDF